MIIMNSYRFSAFVKASALAAALLGAPSVLFAQSYNPTVEVTRKYKGTLPETKKPDMEMAVPDSLLKLRLDFDYSVFETPYQGAYEFKPYRLDMKPQPDAYDGRQLYVKAGLGYAFRPELRAVYSPELKGRFQFDVHALHDSFFGNFRRAFNYGKKYSGHDAKTTFGADGRVDFNSAILTFGVDWNGLGTKDTLCTRNFSAVDFKARLRSNSDRESYFLYDGGIDVRLGNDKYKNDGGNVKLSEVKLCGEFGPVLALDRALIVGVNSDIASYSGNFNSHVSTVSIVPQWRMTINDFKFGLGASMNFCAYGNRDALYRENHTNKPGMIRPDAYASYEAIYERLIFYSTFKGGYDINTYSSMLDRNHFFDSNYGRVATIDGLVLGSALLNTTDVLYDFVLGAKGNVRSKMSFDVRGGFKSVDGGLFETVYAYYSYLLPGIVYANYRQLYAEVDLGWKSEKWIADGSLAFRNTFMEDKNIDLFAPSKVSGDLSVMYLFHSRAKAGVVADFASKRTIRGAFISDVSVPGYLDLGLAGEYEFNRKISFWARGENLLNRDIQRNFGHVEGGIGFVVGVVFSL